MNSSEHRLHREDSYLPTPNDTDQGLRAMTAELLAQAPSSSQHSPSEYETNSNRDQAALLQSLTGDNDSLQGGLPLDMVVGDLHHHNNINGLRDGPDVNQLPFLVKNEIDQDLSGTNQQLGQMSTGSGPSTSNHLIGHDALHMGHQAAVAAGLHHHGIPSHYSHMMNPHLQHLQSHHMLHDLAGTDPRHMHYGGGMSSVGPPDCLTTQKAVAFLAGPRERIHVLGNPVEHCPRCQQEGLGTTGWRPHRHIGELKIRHFDDLESNHHFDIPLCPICNQVLYLYDFNNMLGVSNARRLHKYVLKCANRHVLPLLDLFCQTKKGGERCNANFKLQWCYGTMVKRCESQKNRDHDLWWVRYKNEWKQRRTIIRYKKDFLSHLTDAQRSLLLGLGLEGEPPPDPKTALGPTFDALVSSAGGSPSGPKIKKRTVERGSSLGGHLGSGMGGLDGYDMNPAKRRFRSSDFGNDYSNRLHRSDSMAGDSGVGRHLSSSKDVDPSDSLRHLMGTVVIPTRPPDDQMMYLQQQGGYNTGGTFDAATLLGIPPQMVVTGTPTPPLTNVNGASPVAVHVEGHALIPSQSIQ